MIYSKNKASNSIQYTGTVTLSQYIGEKKVKIAQFNNAGKYSLFNFFSDCLLGDFDIAKNNRPTKIKLLSKNKDPKEGESLYKSESGFIYLYNKPVKSYNAKKGIVQYSFHIYRDILESATFDSIGLYPNSATDIDTDNFAAVVDGITTKNSLSRLAVLVVDWELTISNKNEEIV
jgi:hypothetical protein